VGAPASLAATASSALAATFDRWTSTTCGISGSTLTANSVGLCGVRASQGGNASFHAAPQQLRVLVVIKGDQAITFNALANRTSTTPRSSSLPRAGAPATRSSSPRSRPRCAHPAA
jgi:hypothetical protein